MHGLVTKHAPRADVVAPDLLEVEQRMASLIGLNDEDDTATPNVSSAAAMYHLKTGGQRIRARLALHASNSLGLARDDACSIASTAELLDNASLIHDDLQDRDRSRRGSDTAWVVYGDEIAVCAGDLLLSAAYCALAGVSCKGRLSQMMNLTHSRITHAVRGQCADLSVSRTQPFSIDDYRKIATAKSSALLGWPIELALMAANKTDTLAVAKRAADSFAIDYQIDDDLFDVKADTARGSSAPAINIVQVLQSSHAASDYNASELARNLGRQHLMSAAVASADLPCQAGRLLQQLAIEWHTRLTGRCFQ
ncbi:polyprenyl synthetase family protein [Polaromonas sp. DSR2-3-2]|uniref:polyprenyl synthetase family protein n=1 Tax=unclassified Polaromonas TaxID=2638319 RepID=UPI003CF556EA